MKELLIYGASDDLIELDGVISEECGTEKAKIECSDGTKFNLEYTGEWKVSNLQKGSGFKQLIESVGDEKEHNGEYFNCSSYSDIVVLSDVVDWVKVNRKTFKK